MASHKKILYGANKNNIPTPYLLHVIDYFKAKESLKLRGIQEKEFLITAAS
jgi:hypothetical protein